MDVDFCIQASKKNLNEAREYLKTGRGANWVPQSLQSALHWSMEAWLISHGHSNCGSSWMDKEIAFMEVGPAEIRGQFSACLSACVYLELDLLGGFDDSWPPLPFDKWKIKAIECMDKTDHMLNSLLNEIPRPAQTK